MSHEDAKTTKKSRVMRVGQASPRPPTSQRTEHARDQEKRMLMEEWKILTFSQDCNRMAPISHWAAFQKPSGDPLT